MAASSSDQPSYYSADDVAQHNNAGDLWMIIDQDVYDLSDFIDEHPGGRKSMHPYPISSEGLFTHYSSSFSSLKRGRERCNQEVPKVSPG